MRSIACILIFLSYSILGMAPLSYGQEVVPEILPFLKSQMATGEKDSLVSYSGMFKTYKQGERFYWEIADTLLGRDILVTVTLLKGSARAVRSSDKYGYGGDMLPSGRMIRLVRKGNQISIQEPYCYPLVQDTLGGVYRVWQASQFVPELLSLAIKAKDKAAVLIEVTSLLTEDYSLFSLLEFPGVLQVGSFQASKSGWVDICGFQDNLLIRWWKEYSGQANRRQRETASKPYSSVWEVAANLYLLPKKPLEARYSDPRVGYFTSSYKSYDKNPYGAEPVSVVRRWRLEPKAEDMDRYLRGELVEPVKPIVFYIERTTPTYLIPYFIAAVNAWQGAFEKAGFKNAIVGKLAPIEKEDPDFSIADARHSVISYKASELQNAYGPIVLDPRSGEIICSHIGVFHGIVALARQWYFSQCATVDSLARQEVLPDTLQGKLLQMILTHEIGHSLGLKHNYGGSAVYSINQIRNKEFVRENGYGNSIMDYMRFNYVVQPEDSMCFNDLIPKINSYDEFAIEWGYRYFPQWNVEEECSYLSEWVARKRLDLKYWFGNESDAYDPRKQEDDLSNDPIEASRLGIKNLQLMMAYQTEGALGNDPRVWTWRYAGMKRQYRNYVLHVAKNIGGICSEEGKNTYRIVSEKEQKRAMHFLGTSVFEPPLWLWSPKMSDGTIEDGLKEAEKIYKLLVDELGNKFSIIQRQCKVCVNYSLEAYMDDLHQYIFPKSNENKAVLPYRKCLQRLYVNKLKEMIDDKNNNEWVNSCLFLELKNISAELTRKIEEEETTDSLNYWKGLNYNIKRWISGGK
ncbi:MAG: zinc-dependent metalloprotease [Odoribacter sp.]